MAAATKKRGGARPGAGRKKGSLNKSSVLREALARAGIAADMTPLALMLKAMRDAYAKGDIKAACAYAKDCAPYCHPRLSAVSAQVSIHRAEDMTTEEIEAELLAMGMTPEEIAAALKQGDGTTH